MFGLENLLDEKDMYPYLHLKMFGRHMSDTSIRPSWVFTTEREADGHSLSLYADFLTIYYQLLE